MPFGVRASRFSACSIAESAASAGSFSFFSVAIQRLVTRVHRRLERLMPETQRPVYHYKRKLGHRLPIPEPPTGPRKR
jgi:hypothetical protein